MNYDPRTGCTTLFDPRLNIFDLRLHDDYDCSVPPSESDEKLLLRPPDNFCCSMGDRETMFDDPVCTEDGHTYERLSIQKWFRRRSAQTDTRTGRPLPPTSPLTNMVLRTTILRPNVALKGAIESWKRTIEPALKRTQHATKKALRRDADSEARLKRMSRTLMWQNVVERDREVDRLRMEREEADGIAEALSATVGQLQAKVAARDWEIERLQKENSHIKAEVLRWSQSQCMEVVQQCCNSLAEQMTETHSFGGIFGNHKIEHLRKQLSDFVDSSFALGGGPLPPSSLRRPDGGRRREDEGSGAPVDHANSSSASSSYVAGGVGREATSSSGSSSFYVAGSSSYVVVQDGRSGGGRGGALGQNASPRPPRTGRAQGNAFSVPQKYFLLKL